MQNSLNLEITKLGAKVEDMNKDDVLVSVTASREKDEIVYRVECASDLSKEEFEYYLSEIIKGVCKWNEGICKESIRSFNGKIKPKK